MTSHHDQAAVPLFVNGTLMSGEELHGNLVGARFCGERHTAPRYRLYSVSDRHPAMVSVESGGVAVVGELYEVSLVLLEAVLAAEPDGLGLGVVELHRGERSLGILWMAPLAPDGARDISDFGDWREYRRSFAKPPIPESER